MKLDLTFSPSNDFRRDAAHIQRAEQLGVNAAWTAETARNPFFPLTLAAPQTQTIHLGTQVAVAFPRSPMVTAQIAWDLARQSDGRFILGLGTQVRTHIERRFAEDWVDPVGRMREYIESLRAIWDTFQTDARLRFRGDHYRFRLMAPFFNPGPIQHPDIPIFLAGVNPKMCELAGELCQGMHAHPFHTAAYLRETVLPALSTGLRKAERARSDIAITVPVLAVTGMKDAAMRNSRRRVKERIAFYAGTAAYRRVMQLHGWSSLAEDLSGMARDGLWEEMPAMISDDVLNEIAIVAEPQNVLSAIEERYSGLADRFCLEWSERESQLIESILQSR